MSKIRRQLSGNTSSVVEPKKLSELKSKTGNLYESIAIIGKRANQINISIKEELHSKLEEFASHTDSLEEMHENKEQIEIEGITVNFIGYKDLLKNKRKSGRHKDLDDIDHLEK